MCDTTATINYENREEVDRLVEAFSDELIEHTSNTLLGPVVRRRDAMQAALREFANPTPQIEEPTGLGAVVEDAAGNLWVRAGRTHGGRLDDNWRVTDGDKVGWWSRWDRIDVARVLSEGVPS